MINKNIYLLFTFLTILSLSSFAIPDKGYELDYKKEKDNSMKLSVKLGDYQLNKVNKDGLDYTSIDFSGKNITTNKKGWAELPYFGIPVQLPDNKNVDVEVVSVSYNEIDIDFPLIPSRGVITRDQDPDEIPYNTDPNSITDDWYPASNLKTSEPYILRKIRGENIYIYPFQYNAVKKTLKVVKDITIKITPNDDSPVNPLSRKDAVNIEMNPVYESLFVNYKKDSRWSEEIAEFGDILVIYTSAYNSAIQDWIKWKKQKGYNVEELEVSAGANVVSDIQSEYDNNNNLLYVLLVGDWADVQTDMGTSSNAPIDPMAGCVAGGDDYSDIIIGRFSAESAADVTAQADKSIEYEKNPVAGGAWYSKALGIASDEGAGMGDDGESDQEHIDLIHSEKLQSFTYNTTSEEYDPGVAAADVANHIDGGVGLINYTGHGGHNSWVTSGYSANDATSATNTNEHPFVFSVACVVGEFHTGGDCLAEGLLRNPDGGALVAWMSTINQPWTPPMRGQDYANDLVIQGFDYSGSGSDGTSISSGRTTFGSITFNAGALMIAESSSGSDWDTYKTWTIFGDPSVQVRTEAPNDIAISNMTVTSNTYETTITSQGNPFEGAIVSLWKAGHQPASAVTDASGFVSIDHSFTGNVKLTVTGFNLDTYSDDHTVTSPVPPEAHFMGDPLVIPEGGSVQFTDTSTNGPFTSWAWTFEAGNPATSTDSQPSPVIYMNAGTYDVELRVEDTNGDQYTKLKEDYITVVPDAENPPEADFIANYTVISPGESVNFHDISTGNAYEWEWTFESAQPNTSDDQHPNNITYPAEGEFDVMMIAKNSAGRDTVIKEDYILVSTDDPCTGVPVADFRASNRLLTTGETIYFENLSENYPSSWFWNFNGGIPASSTFTTPVNGVQYNTPDIYNVSLRVESSCGNDMHTKENYIYVFSGPVPKYCDTMTNVRDGESSTKISVGNWGNLAGHNSERVRYYADYFETYSFTQIESLVVPVHKSVYGSYNSYITFYIWSDEAGMPTDSTILKEKKVYLRNIPENYNSVIEFDQPVEIEGPFYAGFKINYPDNDNNGISDDNFVVGVCPSRGSSESQNTLYVYEGGEWKSSVEKFDIATSMGIKPRACLVDIDEFDIYTNIHTYPNPTSGILTLELGDEYRNKDIDFQIFDLTGRLLKIESKKYSDTEYTIDFSDQSPGMYYLNVFIDGKKVSKKISVVR